jgi:hypothetical protein
MNQRVEEEIEHVREGYWSTSSYCRILFLREMAPFNGETACELHNQTMTLTLISE